ncbi:MAG: hypothetical protein GDA43_05230 [Hormoscilla sp. SP5CHS1]|nr:hypothetical protein [Hormoscilla sp. SP12CHS1]MBC6452666.1 hypothetical protein [Hormoscilla sp. SP5CHS1]MBC6476304.1 hypothetical protein [Hormoscilla sp. GM102CHS1]
MLASILVEICSTVLFTGDRHPLLALYHDNGRSGFCQPYRLIFNVSRLG